MNMDKAELLKKVKVLSEKGNAGEKENAQKMLEKLMKKYNISDLELDEEKIIKYDIKWANKTEEKLKAQIFYSVVGDINDDKKFCSYYRAKNGCVYCTASEYLEFEAKCEFYIYHLKIELDRYFRAFIQKNDLFPPLHLIKEREQSEEKLTEEDFKMLELALKIDKHNFVKQIERSK